MKTSILINFRKKFVHEDGMCYFQLSSGSVIAPSIRRGLERKRRERF